MTKVFSDVQPLPVFVRTARFLEEDGSTRLESYLGIQRKELITGAVGAEREVLRDTLLVQFGVTVEDGALRPQGREQRTVVVFSKGASSRDDILLEQLDVRTRLDSFFVSVQVESWQATPGAGLSDSLAPRTGENGLSLRSVARLKLTVEVSDLTGGESAEREVVFELF